MRLARIKLRGRQAVYHCMSRVVGGQALLDEVAREKLVAMIRQQSRFCGVEAITYCIMPNHFHVLIRVPEPSEPSDGELLRRMEALYGRQGALVQLAREQQARLGHLPRDLRAGLLARMGDVSAFMKELKQRFSRWYNRRHDRFGTLWAERFKSVLVEDQPKVVGTMAAYIDLNPVRAGLVADPKDYRFCGYAAALAGNAEARGGLMSFLNGDSWRAAAAEYRRRLYVRSGVSGHSGKQTVDRERIKRTLAAGGRLRPGEVLRLRLRYLTDGVILGSKDFVEEMFTLHREKFGPKRRTGARPLRGAPLPELRVLRDLRRAAVT